MTTDPSVLFESHEHLYVTPDYYGLVAADVLAWRDPGPPVNAISARAVEQFLFHENRLVDAGRFEEWLDLFTEDCLYWIPTVVEDVDPTTQLCTAFDDHRRLEDRIVRLRTGTAYSQLPASRTCRTITNLEVWESDLPGELRARCAVVIHEWRVGEMRALPGWYSYVLRTTSDSVSELSEREQLKIVRKQIDLVQADVPLRNMTFMI
jgi:3-phenylpropionate/cinnamic acid dioxygenase small subunit